MTTITNEIRRWRRPRKDLFIGELFVNGVYWSDITLATLMVTEYKEYFILETLTDKFKVNKAEEET